MIVNDKIKNMSMMFELVKWVEQIIRSEAVKDCASKLLDVIQVGKVTKD